MPSSVTRVPAAKKEEALAHFSQLLRFETDCWDVHHAMTNNRQDFVLLDVRSQQCYDTAHIEGAINLPWSKINQTSLQQFDPDILIVVYCAGPHCNATEKAAIKIATLSRDVKKMIGGITGWIDEGFNLKSPS